MLLRNVCCPSRRNNTDRSQARSASEVCEALRWAMAFVPEGQADRSLARSAWKSVPRKNRPVGYGMIGRSQLIPETRNHTINFVGLSFCVRISWLQSSNRRAHLHESHRTLRDGSLGVAVSQALRARLRSHRPSGTSRNRF
jgi:hypothetical protein